MRLVFLHTAESNIALFDKAARDANLAALELTHVVRADLLAAAERAGGSSAAIATQTQAALLALCKDAHAVVLTCSTLGTALDDALAARAAPVPVLRADAALAHRAVKNGGTVAVLFTAPTTYEPTMQLFLEAATHTGAKVELKMVDGAWERFKAGDSAAYLSAIAAAADAAYANGADVVALAQASMTGARGQVTRGKPLTSPEAAIAAAVHAAALPD